MNKRLEILVKVLVLGLVGLSGCARNTDMSNTPDSSASGEVSIQIGNQSLPPEPQMIQRYPYAGQQLPLTPAIDLVFDRPMDAAVTEDAWSFRGPDGKLISGVVSWPDENVLRFEPDEVLDSESEYKGVLAAGAAGAAGEPLSKAIVLNFQTVGGLQVAQVFPPDESRNIDGKSAITVIFNRPVVPLVVVEEEDQHPDPIEITPDLPGHGEWVNPSVYVFQPEEYLNGGSTYHIRIARGLQDVSGLSLEEAYAWSFSTAPPAITGLALKNGARNPKDSISEALLDQAFIVTFNLPMDTKSVAEAVSIVDVETGSTIPIRLEWNEDHTVLLIEPVRRYRIASFYSLTIAETAKEETGGQLSEGRKLKFATLPRPQIVAAWPTLKEKPKRFNTSMYIQFNTLMDFDTLKGKVKITPEPPGEVTTYFNTRDKKLYVYGLQPSTDYVVRALPGMADIYGNRIQSEFSFSFQTKPRSPAVNLLLPRDPLVYRVNGEQEIFIEYTNVEFADIEIYALSAEEFNRLLDSGKYREYNPAGEEPVRSMTRDSTGKDDEVITTRLDLLDNAGRALPPGYYFVGVKAEPFTYKERFLRAQVFVVATENITFKTTDSEAMAWLVDMNTGLPVGGVELTFYDKDFNELGMATTDADGLAYRDDLKEPRFISAGNGDRIAFASNAWGSGMSGGDFGVWTSYYHDVDQPLVYLYTDRPLYRPGQEVHFKGILRESDDLAYSLPDETEVRVKIWQGDEEVFSGTLPLSEMGTFAGTFFLEDDSSLGSYNINVMLSGESNPVGGLSFRVAEYRKPEFEVFASSDTAEVLAGETVSFNVDAAYYSGGYVQGAEVEWRLEASPYTFRPGQGYGRYSFINWNRDVYYRYSTSSAFSVVAEGEDAVDEEGHFSLSHVADLEEGKGSQRIEFQANVTDIAGNLVVDRTAVIVHQSEIYAGVRATQYIGKEGEEQSFDLVVLDWDSEPVANAVVDIQFVERQWYSVQEKAENGQLRWVTSVREYPVAQINQVRVDEKGEAQVSFVPPSGGVYKAIVTVRDSGGNRHQASAFMWVSSRTFVPWRQTNDRSFDLITDKDEYTPGDTAEILIAQPYEGEVYGLVTIERGHIQSREVILLENNSTIYQLPITKDMAPAVYISVTVVKGAGENAPPDFRMGLTQINVDTNEQTLEVEITTDKETAGPGDEVTYSVQTRDLAGNPAQSEVSFSLVDKAVLALSGPNSGPILASFYPLRALHVRTSVALVLSAEHFNAKYEESDPDGGGAGGGGGNGSGDLGIITVREDFKDTAYFEAQVMTDEDGTATAVVTLPENLTTWAMDVRAITADTRVGQGAHELQSTKPLFAQMQAPRFFVVGDQAQVGALVHNTTDEDMSVAVTLEAKGVKLLSGADQSVEVGAGKQAYVTWNLVVDEDAERVDFTAHASSGSYSDSSKPALGTLAGQGIPVYTYHVRENVGASGVVRNGDTITEAIYLPSELDFNKAELKIEVAPSLAGAMQDGLTYLQDYPHLCMEQTVSRLLPNAISLRILKMTGETSSELLTKLNRQVGSALQRIYAKQNPDGGWGWWSENESQIQTSAYVVLGLLEAQEAGFRVSERALEDGIDFLKKQNIRMKASTAVWEGNRQAFVYYVLARAGELRESRLTLMYKYRDNLSLYGKAYLLQALDLSIPEDERIDTLLNELINAGIKSAGGVNWEEAETDYWNWNTDTRTTAIVLNALIQVDPDNPLVANGVRWLMAHRTSGHWRSTQETAWALMALTNWLAVSGEFQTNYNYAVGLNGELLSEGEATRENLTTPDEVTVNLAAMLRGEINYLVFGRDDGPGTLYYATDLMVELPVLEVEPLDRGIIVSRQYYALDDLNTPISEMQQGELVRVKITIVAPNSLHYVVVTDPLPAGLEAVDTSLKISPDVPQTYTLQDYRQRGWGWWFFDYAQMFDERVVLSADYLPRGTYVYTYLARASTVGEFRVIPVTAEEFYFPDVYGRGAGSLFIVTP